jgi:ClpP class serine protease
MCAGWSDGHDAIAERMMAALAEGDVVMVVDSPGGAHAGLQENVRRVLEAKEQHGRHVTAYADEMIGSAAYWWVACVADEIYAPESAIVGSIGARAAHASVAGALAAEGVAVTYFAAPGAGKVAFAPELPLSDLGKERGERDVWQAFEAFAAAVGPRRGLTRDDIVALDADALSGELALNAKLIDGLSSLEDVLGYALTVASATTNNTADATTQDTNMKLRSEGPSKGKPEGDEPDGDENDSKPVGVVPTECRACGLNNESDAKFCKACGTSMAVQPGADEEEEEEEEEEDDTADVPPDSEPAPAPPGKKAPPPPPPKAAQPPPPERAARASSLAGLAGLREGASTPAIKSALIPVVGLAEFAMRLTETRSPAEARGALTALVEDAAAAGKLRTELRDSKRAANARERMDLLRKLSAAALPGYTRGELFVDDVNETSGKRTMRAAPQYAEMKLGTLRGLVESKLKNAGPAKRSPFEPDASVLASAGAGGAAAVTSAAIEAAKKHPAVVAAAARPGAAPIEQLAAAHAAATAIGFQRQIHGAHS